MNEEPPPSPDDPDAGAGARARAAPDAPAPLARRLDPDLAAAAAPAPPAAAEEPPEFDPRRYRWAIGIFGFTILAVLAVIGFTRSHPGTPGVEPGQPMHRFVAPLATAPADLDPNVGPRCDAARPNPEGLNVCNRTPLVLAFFVTGSASCERQVDALQALSRQPAFRGVQFAALAIRASRRSTLTEVRRHRWTIPVAYDRDGSVGNLYGVEICPLVQVARAGGAVTRRLIGVHWTDPAALAVAARSAVSR